MEIGERPEDDLPALPELGQPRRKLLDLLAQVRMGQHDPLGDAGRPAGVLVHGHILEAALHRRRIGAVLLEAFLPIVEIRGRLDIAEGVLLEPSAQDALDGREIVPDAGVTICLIFVRGRRSIIRFPRTSSVIRTLAPESLNWCSSSGSE